MKRKVTGIVAAVLMATIGTTLLALYVQSARERVSADEELVDVYVVTEPIAQASPGSSISGRVKQTSVPARLRPEGAVSELSEIEELVTTVELLPGEQLLRDRFATAGEAARGAVPPGLLQISVALDIERVVGGNLRVGDTVGVLLSYEPPVLPYETHLELNEILVTDVQFQSAGMALTSGKDLAIEGVEPATPPGKYVVTLAVTAAQGEQLVHGLEHGQIWLAAQTKGSSRAGTRVVNPANVYSARIR